MKLALISMDQVWEDKHANKSLCQFYIKKASENHCDLVIFPEMTLTGFSMNAKQIAEHYNNSPSINWFRKQSVNYSIHILFGIALKFGNGEPSNNLTVISPNGEIIVNYRKIHLFSPAGENIYYRNGHLAASFDFMGHRIGVAICYDLRFSELYQFLSSRCAMIITIANWPAARIEHWSALLKARAIENQTFICGVNRTGTDGNNIEYIKSNLLFDPMGCQVQPLLSDLELDIFNIDLTTVKQIRENLPYKNDRQENLYQQFLSNPEQFQEKSVNEFFKIKTTKQQSP